MCKPIYYVQKRVKITSHYIVTLQFKTKIMLFKAEFKINKLKMKINKTKSKKGWGIQREYRLCQQQLTQPFCQSIWRGEPF